MDKIDIATNIDNPRHLEKLYRHNKTAFKSEFNLLYPELTDHKIADYWNERLNFESSDISWGSSKEIIFVIIISLIAGIIAKFPAIFNLNADLFYQRNIGFIVFPVLTAYFIRKNRLPAKNILLAAVVFLTSLFFINLLPFDNKSDTLILSCIHLLLLLWAVSGFSYTGVNLKDQQKRIDFLKYNGDLLSLTALMVIAGGLLTAITIGLFSVIGLHIEKFYFDYVVVFGLAAVPAVATHIVQSNPELVNRISPLIAKLFSPLVLIMLVIYLAASFFSGKDPYQDRNFLIIFNLLLIGVMAIILFSVAGRYNKNEKKAEGFILFALSLVTVIVNIIALSAIIYRISEWGMTPNRLAVLGGNVLMLTNLFIVTFRLFKNVSQNTGGMDVENSISKFLPVYILWAIVVTFIFPLIFHFK
jgi:hypothetical protein